MDGLQWIDGITIQMLLIIVGIVLLGYYNWKATQKDGKGKMWREANKGFLKYIPHFSLGPLRLAKNRRQFWYYVIGILVALAPMIATYIYILRTT